MKGVQFCDYDIFRGSAIFQALTYFILWILQVTYIIYTEKYKTTWPGWSVKSLEDWKSYLKLAIPGVGHVAFEEIIWEAALFISGIIGTIELGAQSILYQIETLLYMIPLGFGTAACIRIGNFLGGNSVIGAKSCSRTAFAVAGILYIVICAIIQSCSSVIPYIFSDDERVTSLASSLFYLLVISFFTDMQLGISNGILRACGRQLIGATTIVIGYYVIGFPIILALVFVGKFKLMGIWIGLLSGHFIMTVGNTVMVIFTDWPKMVHQAIDGSKLTKESGTQVLPSSEMKIAQNLKNDKRKSLILRRTLQTLVIVLILAAAILFKLNFPREMYFPNLNNSTIDSNMTSF